MNKKSTNLLNSLTPLPAVTFQPLPGVTILGVGHKARQGKDHTCALIHTLMPATSRVMSLADDLKALARCYFGMSVKDSNLLQRIGAQVREIDQDHWVKALYARILEARPQLVLIPDVRYRNEVAFIKRMGGRLLKVERYQDGAPFRDEGRDPTHQSEIELDHYDGWDWTLQNTGTRWDFDAAISDFWTQAYHQVIPIQQAA